MRWKLLQCFDEIYILNLHGNSKKKETGPDGSSDKNVFDIQQGVSINIFIKHGKKSHDELARLFYHDLYGMRAEKYEYLWESAISHISWEELAPCEPMYFFVPRNITKEKEYQGGFSIADLFPVNSVGIATARDAFTIQKTPEEVRKIIHEFVQLPPEDARSKYALRKDVRDWKVRWAQADLEDSGLSESNILPILYRPFDIRYTYYTGRSRGFHCMPRGQVMRHILRGDNVCISTSKGVEIGREWEHVFVCNHLSD
jgi:predicted helicase